MPSWRAAPQGKHLCLIDLVEAQQARRNHASLLEALAAHNSKQRIQGDKKETSDDAKAEEDLPVKVGGKRLGGSGLDAGTSRMQQLISLVEGSGDEGSQRKKAKIEADSDGSDQVRVRVRVNGAGRGEGGDGQGVGCFAAAC